MDAKNNNKLQGSVIVVGVIGLVLGFFLGWLIGRGNDMTPPVDMNVHTSENVDEADDVTTTDLNVDTENGVIRNSLQDNQAPVESTLNVNTADATFATAAQNAGATVKVTDVDASKVTWVAIRENVNGKLGNILGARRIEAGSDQDVDVALLRPTVAGKEYFAVLFEDNGDKVFNHKTDMQVVKSGAVLAAGFKAN